MKRIHIAIATQDIAATIADYTARLGLTPCVAIAGEYALWRTETVNLSVRQDANAKPGTLRHLGWEDPNAMDFTESVDVNGITWERFTARQQAAEIEEIWPGSGFQVNGK
ncbi:MAG: hypothetical protein AAFY11_00515 [Cyanobacteria bacterium J06641_5]